MPNDLFAEFTVQCVLMANYVFIHIYLFNNILLLNIEKYFRVLKVKIKCLYLFFRLNFEIKNISNFFVFFLFVYVSFNYLHIIFGSSFSLYF